VPVVADGRIFVASYKALTIFELGGSAAAEPEPAVQQQSLRQPAPAELPPDSHEIFGTIETISGSSLTLTTRTGQRVGVDTADAWRTHHSVVLLVGEPVTVFGRYDRSGVLRATSVLHAKPSPIGWPPDR